MAKSSKSIATTKAAAGGGGGSFMGFLIGLVVITLIGGGAGGFLGLQLEGLMKKPTKEEEEALKLINKHAEALEPTVFLLKLAPLVTNIASPPNTWLRLEASIVVKADPEINRDLLQAKVTEDILAYMRTIPLAQIEGASGLQNLRDDLIDRARIRSEGKVEDFIIGSLIIE